MKELKSLGPSLTGKGFYKLERTQKDFPLVKLDIKKMVGKRKHHLRVGKIRALFYYEKGKTIVYAIRPRRELSDELEGPLAELSIASSIKDARTYSYDYPTGRY